MCGILAVLNGDEEKAAGLIRHRGTRMTVVDHGGVLLLHTRLPIVGLGREHDQPVRRGEWAIAFVGQILDFRDTHPGAECDAELVADAWTEMGHLWFQSRDGFWSVAAVRDGEIHLLADYLCQKPMYYRSDAAAIGAASEPDAVAALGPVTPDEVYFSSVVKWGYCPETWRTPYREIRKTLPGEWVRLARTPGRVDRKILDLLVPRPLSNDLLKHEIVEAVRRRVQSSDVPVAALVSGGLDSAVVYTLARRFGDVVPFHVENDEIEEAISVVAGEVFPDFIPDHEVEMMDRWEEACTKLVQLQDPYTTVERALQYMQEPVDLGSLMPQTCLSDAVGAAQVADYPKEVARVSTPETTPAPPASSRVHVCLTGDGADELFGGYGRAMRYDSQGSDVWHELVGYHLPRLDRVMMRNLVEVRSPFLARRVAAAALALPWAERRNKKVLRMLFRDDLPRGVAERPKRPLRTATVESDREANSRQLVDIFRRRVWG